MIIFGWFIIIITALGLLAMLVSKDGLITKLLQTAYLVGIIYFVWISLY